MILSSTGNKGTAREIGDPGPELGNAILSGASSYGSLQVDSDERPASLGQHLAYRAA